MEKLELLEKEIEQIKQRNKKVEIDKAWEISYTRKIIIAILTYIVVVLFFYFAKLTSPFINAIVPTIGFLLSTLSISLFKKLWIKYFLSK